MWRRPISFTIKSFHCCRRAQKSHNLKYETWDMFLLFLWILFTVNHWYLPNPFKIKIPVVTWKKNLSSNQPPRTEIPQASSVLYGRLFIKSEDNVHKWCEGICVKSWGKTGGIPHLHHLSSTKTHTCTTSDPGNWNKRNLFGLGICQLNSMQKLTVFDIW